MPLRIDIPPTASIELWDSGLLVSAHAGDTLQTLAARYRVPFWALTQVNNLSGAAELTKGERIIMPRYLTQWLRQARSHRRQLETDADLRVCSALVCFWHKADMAAVLNNVRFWE